MADIDLGDHLNSNIAELIRNYFEINSDDIVVLLDEPSPLLFMKHVARNRPFLFKGGCSRWEAFRKWDTQYMAKLLGDTSVEIAETPSGSV